MKRLIVCCDGTWQISTQQHPSNIALLSRAITPLSSSTPPIQQVVYYQSGVGASSNSIAHLFGLIFGQGLSDNVRDAYLYICNNWCKQDGIADEIYLFGFSRGAYIARCVASLICEFGLLTRQGIDAFGELYEFYTTNKFSFTEEFLRRFETEYPGCREREVKVKFVGVFDTVGSLGTPEVYLFGRKLWLLNYILQRTSAPHQFGNTHLLPNIQYAYQALALNEERAPFVPTLWSLKSDNSQKLKQVWFPGNHTAVGGGSTFYDISNISLAWMVQKIKTNTDLECDLEYLKRGFVSTGPPMSFGPNDLSIPWGCGTWFVNRNLVYRLGGTTTRNPQRDEKGGERKRCEFVHKSVRARIKFGKYSGPDVSALDEDESDDEVEEFLRW